jgi:hypothetical protein
MPAARRMARTSISGAMSGAASGLASDLLGQVLVRHRVDLAPIRRRQRSNAIAPYRPAAPRNSRWRQQEMSAGFGAPGEPDSCLTPASSCKACDTNPLCDECTELCMANKGGDAGSAAPRSPAAPVKLSGNLEASLRRALALAHQRRHDSATPEHLLQALIDDEDAAAVMAAVHADLDGLSRALPADDDSQVENPISDGR